VAIRCRGSTNVSQTKHSGPTFGLIVIARLPLASKSGRAAGRFLIEIEPRNWWKPCWTGARDVYMAQSSICSYRPALISAQAGRYIVKVQERSSFVQPNDHVLENGFVFLFNFRTSSVLLCQWAGASSTYKAWCTIASWSKWGEI